jgi:DNA polymerase lambda
MFKGLNFTVVPFGVDIGKKRKKILEDIIIKNEGKIIKIEKINNNLIPDFILTSKNVKNIFDIFNRKQIGSIPKEKRIEFLNIIFKRIINFEWLTQCVLQKKIVDTDDYLIDIEELGIKKQSRSRVASQNYKVEGIEKLKEELCAIDHDKSFSQNQNVNRNSITNDTSIEDINILNVNNSQNSNTFTLSSFNSNAFDLDNELNDLSDEELFNKIKNMVVNKNEKDEDTNKYINSEDFNLSNSFNPSFDASQKFISKENIISESQEIKPSMESLDENNSKEGVNSVPKPILKNKFIKKINSSYFAFNMGKSKLSENKNKHLTDEFEKILEFHNNEGNKFEALAYRKVIGILKKYKEEINDVNKIPKIKGIGPKITEKIREILLTGKCRKSDNVANDSKNKCIKELTSVHGIGIKQANEFFAKGIKSVNDLKNIFDILPNTIKKGLKYYDDIQIKIPREEITELFKIIEEELYQILDKNILKAEVVGSYRRGKKLCGDMDVIITRIDNGKISGILHTLLERLTIRNIIIDTLTMSDKNDVNCEIFMGICKLNEKGLNRRLDIKVYEKSFFPFAILYFTGSAYFNRSLRLFAKKKGYHLSDKELSDRITGDKILCNSEEDIFKALSLKYKTPEERDI